MPSPTIPLPRKTVYAFSALSLPTSALGLPITVYLPPFYADELGLGLAVVGLIFTVARLWDVVTDPIMGVVIDKFPSRWGRRRHWIVLANPLLLLAAWYIYMPAPGAHSAGYLLGWLVVLYVGYTFLSIAHQSWGAELTTEYDERSRLFGWRELMSIVGMVTVLTLPAIIEQSGGDVFDKIASMGWYLLILLPITTFIILYVVPERPFKIEDEVHVPLKEAVRAVLMNVPLRRLLVADFAVSFGIGATGSTYLFLVTWVFGQSENASIILLTYFVSGLLAMPLWMKLAYRLGKHKTIVVASCYAMVALLGFPIAAEIGNTPFLILVTMLFGVVFGAAPMILRAMMADIADMDELETGKNRAGLLFAFLTTTNKVGGALSVSVTYAILAWVGFDPSAIENSAAAQTGLLWTFVMLPMLVFGITALALRRYPLDQDKHKQIRQSLDQISNT